MKLRYEFGSIVMDEEMFNMWQKMFSAMCDDPEADEDLIRACLQLMTALLLKIKKKKEPKGSFFKYRVSRN